MKYPYKARYKYPTKFNGVYANLIVEFISKNFGIVVRDAETYRKGATYRFSEDVFIKIQSINKEVYNEKYNLCKG